MHSHPRGVTDGEGTPSTGLQSVKQYQLHHRPYLGPNQRGEVEAFTEHVHAVDNRIKLKQEGVRWDSLSFLDCAVHNDEDRTLNIEVYRNPTHTDQYMLFSSHHPLEQAGGHQNLKTIRLRPRPLSQRGRNKSSSGEHLKPVATQTGPLSKLPTDPERRRWENVTTSSFPMSQEHLKTPEGL